MTIWEDLGSTAWATHVLAPEGSPFSASSPVPWQVLWGWDKSIILSFAFSAINIQKVTNVRKKKPFQLFPCFAKLQGKHVIVYF